jgi:DNA-binding Lrp family transcriptional regulator
MDAAAVIAPSPLALFNRWQRGLPLVPRPYDALGEAVGMSGAEVIEALREGLAGGAISRVGGVFGVGAGGAAMLCAMEVAPGELDAVAALVNAEPGVNHNYAREHRLNLWFVATAVDAGALQASVERIERAAGVAVLRLPMRRAYRIDLGFDVDVPVTAQSTAPHAPAAPVPPAQRALAARLEEGLPLVERPYAALGAPLGLDEGDVIAALRDWCERGTLRRLGVVLRHHEFGITANAMTVFDVPADAIDAAGARLAAQPGVTLCYRRDAAPGWPYTLYFMVHGRERAAVSQLIEAATRAAGLADRPREVLFSTRRYKQVGGRYFGGALR